MSRHAILSLVQILFFFIALPAKTMPLPPDYVVAGTVSDLISHRGLPAATVCVHVPGAARPICINTDAQGAFDLHLAENPLGGMLYAWAPGYDTFSMQLGTDAARLSIEMRRAPQIVEVIVEAAGRPGESLPTATLDARELSLSRGQDLGGALSRLAGVTLLKTGATISKPVIHGLQGSRLLILNNGIRQEGQQWGTEHAPEMDPYMSARLSVIYGAGALRYAHDAIAGVVKADADSLPATKGQQLNLAAAGQSNGFGGSLHTNYALSGALRPKGRIWSARVGGTLNRAGNVRSPGYYQPNTAMEARALTLSAGSRTARNALEVLYSEYYSRLGILSSSHIGNLTDLQTAISRGRPDGDSPFTYRIARPNQKILHRLFKAHGRIVSRDGRQTLALTLSRQENRRREWDTHAPQTNEPGAADVPMLEYLISTETGELALTRNAGRLRYTLGIQALHQVNTWAGQYFIPNFTQWEGGALASFTYQFSRLTLEGTARVDTRRLNAYFYQGNELLSPQRQWSHPAAALSVNWRPARLWSVNAGATNSWRAPSPSELYSAGLHHGAAALEYGSANLQPEIANGLFLKTLARAEGRWRTEALLYITRLDNFIQLLPTGRNELTVRGAYPVFTYSQRNTLQRGIDLSATYDIDHHIALEAKGSLLRVTDRADNTFLSQMPADRAALSIDYHERPPASEGRSSYTLRLTIEGVARQKRLAPDDKDMAPPPPGYILLHADATLLPAGRYGGLSLALEINNILNKPYKDYLDRFRYFTYAPGRNIALKMALPIGLGPKSTQ